MKPRYRPLIVLGCVAVTAMPGCSYLFSRPPSPLTPQANFVPCSSSRWPVVGDAYWAVNAFGFTALASGVALSESERQSKAIGPSWDDGARQNDSVKSYWIVAGLAAAATIGIVQSARYGLQSARDCDDAQYNYFRGVGAVACTLQTISR
ncbi:MAG: hypothetical protein SGI86_08210, partial [Deltaproteobacteria bacterium]|nr:hypothetical protein [Deltaproteobacteria bacterium]